MKKPALIVTLCLGMAGLAFAGDLSDAAKGAKSKRKKSTSKVITNADVKRSKGRIAETPNLAPAVEQEPTLTEKFEARKAAEKAASELRAKDEKLVADLERQLAAIEQQYYDENDLDRRDTEIVKEFNDVKAELEQARAALAALLPVAVSPSTANRQPPTDPQLP